MTIQNCFFYPPNLAVIKKFIIGITTDSVRNDLYSVVGEETLVGLLLRQECRSDFHIANEFQMGYYSTYPFKLFRVSSASKLNGWFISGKHFSGVVNGRIIIIIIMKLNCRACFPHFLVS